MRQRQIPGFLFFQPADDVVFREISFCVATSATQFSVEWTRT